MSRQRSSILLLLLLLPILLVLAVALTACDTNRPASEVVDDAAITSQVKSKLAADPQVNPFDIDVDTLDGVVTLRGEVEKAVARSEAEKHAASVAGVQRVVNDIEVVPAAEDDEERASDARIGAAVKSKFAADPQLNPFNIDVDTLDGVVTLSGVVESESHRAEAEKLAQSVDGVQQVNNELQVK